MLQTRLVAQKDFKKQVLILKILSEICKDCFDLGSEYITRHYFEEIFDINHIISVSDGSSAKFERDFFLVEFYLSALGKKRAFLTNRVSKTSGLFRPFIRIVLE